MDNTAQYVEFAYTAGPGFLIGYGTAPADDPTYDEPAIAARLDNPKEGDYLILGFTNDPDATGA